MKNFSLSEQELNDFHKNGFAGPFTIYTPEEMTENFHKLRRDLLDTSNSVFKSKEAVSGVTNLASYDRHLDIPFLFNHIQKPEISDRVGSILGEDLICWRTEFFPKYPGDEGTDWHQVKDFSSVTNSKKPHIQWPEGSTFAGTISVWTAMTDATIENGCLQFIPGSHGVMYYDESKKMNYSSEKINRLYKDGNKRGFFGYDFSDLRIDDEWKPDESKAVSMEMKAGQCIIFWSTLLHASHPHLGKTRQMRLGYTARYVPTSVKIYPGAMTLEEFGGKANLERYRTVLVSGKDNYHHNRIISNFSELSVPEPI